MRPLFGANGVTVQRINDGIAARFVFLVAGGQENNCLAVDGIAFQIAFKRGTVDLDCALR